MTPMKDVYIVLTGTGTAFSGMIRWFTKAELNHASIAFDGELREVYSFGRKKVRNPFIGGLIREDFSNPFYSGADCAVYRLTVSAKEYDAMYSHVMGMMQHQDRYKYHLLGLIGVLLNIKINRENAYFCSHFVATVLEESKKHPVDKPPCFVTPEDFAMNLCPHKIYSGKLYYYLRKTRHTAYRPAASLHNTAAVSAISAAPRMITLKEERAEEVV